MKTIVTGGAGFIGSNLVDALTEAGDRVAILDDLSTGRRANLDGAIERGADLRVVDITDAAAVAAAFAEHDPDRCFHLGAQSAVRRAVAEPAFDARVNVVGTVNVLEAARRVSIPTVFASTGGAIYGDVAAVDLPLAECAPCAPEAPYGVSKMAAEGYVDFYARAGAVPGASLRLGNVYGPRQDPAGEAGVVAIFCGKLASGGRPTVYGDGAQTRDYVYVDDVVRAFLAAATKVAGPGPPLPGPINIGTGIETSVLDLVERLARISGSDGFEPMHEPPRAGEVQRISLDSGLAARELGWRPEVGLDRGLEQTLATVGD